MSTSRTPRGRKTIARHGRLRSIGPVAQFFRALAVAMAVLLVAGGGVAADALFDRSASCTADAVDLPDQPASPPDLGELEGGVNLLLVGTDECEAEFAQYFGDRCSGPDAEGSLNDVNMLVHISDEPRRVTVISFPRDLIVPIPACTDASGDVNPAMSAQQINSAYTYGGLACVVKTISDLSGQQIPFAAKVSFGGVINITDAIGGVDVCIANGIDDPYTGIDWPAGMRLEARLATFAEAPPMRLQGRLEDAAGRTLATAAMALPPGTGASLRWDLPGCRGGTFTLELELLPEAPHNGLGGVTLLNPRLSA